MGTASTCTRFFFRQDRVMQPAQLHPPCFLSLTKTEKIADQRLSYSIDLKHSSRLAWNSMNNLPGRTRNPHRSCPISSNSIASQIVQNGIHKTKNRELARLVLQEVFELWRIPTPPDKYTSKDFSPNEFACASTAKVWKSSWH